MLKISFHILNNKITNLGNRSNQDLVPSGPYPANIRDDNRETGSSSTPQATASVAIPAAPRSSRVRIGMFQDKELHMLQLKFPNENCDFCQSVTGIYMHARHCMLPCPNRREDTNLPIVGAFAEIPAAEMPFFDANKVAIFMPSTGQNFPSEMSALFLSNRNMVKIFFIKISSN